MTALAAVPLPIAIAAAALLVSAAAFALIGSIGLLRLKTFYERIHPPTVGTSSATILTAAASMILFSVLETRPVVHQLVLVVFMTLTTPVTFMLLLRAAMLRDRAEGRDPTARDDSAAIGEGDAAGQTGRR